MIPETTGGSPKFELSELKGSEWKVIQAYQVMAAEEKAKAEEALLLNKKLQYFNNIGINICVYCPSQR